MKFVGLFSVDCNWIMFVIEGLIGVCEIVGSVDDWWYFFVRFSKDREVVYVNLVCWGEMVVMLLGMGEIL